MTNEIRVVPEVSARRAASPCDSRRIDVGAEDPPRHHGEPGFAGSDLR